MTPFNPTSPALPGAGPVLWTAQTAAAAVAGQALGADWAATGVSIDSRTLVPGDLFVALKGPSFDGHAFVDAAFAAGAAAAVVASPPPDLAPGTPLVVVADTLTALQDLGRVARLRSGARIAAVTGSVGKTGTKEALRDALALLAPTHGAAGSLNNHWGVPLSLARMPPGATYGVFELGMNHGGEIGPLSRMVQPDVAIITTVEPVHLEHFASVEAIAEAKAEIFEGMEPAGIAVLNRDNPHFPRLVAAARTQGLARIWSFGSHAQADARLIDCSTHATCSAVTADIHGERLHYRLSLPGRHHVLNSLAVLLAVRALGGEPGTAAQALSRLTALKGRGRRRRIAAAQGSFVMIDESYNASPVSMAAAFEVLGRSEPGAGGRRLAVLGDMLELGAAGAAWHGDLAGPIEAAGIDLVFCCGPLMRGLHDRLPPGLRGGHAPDSAALAPLVGAAVRAGDIVMVKGSLGSRMGRVVEALTALEPSGSSPAGAAPVAASV